MHKVLARCCSCRQIVVAVTLSLFVGTTNAQNLVSDPGFEEPLTNPNFNPAGVGGSPHWSSLEGTTDFFHTDYPYPHGIPANWRGTQEPFEGVGYAGIISDFTSEYLVMKLKQPLMTDQIYDLSFQVNLSEQSAHGLDGLGAVVMTDQPKEDDLDIYHYTIRNPEGNILTDTATWVTIGGQFRAEGGEEYLLIGSLPDHEISKSESLGGVAPWAYYFIDDVYLAPCPKPVITRFELDTTACEGTSLYLTGLPGANSHRWQYGDPSISQIVEESGVYILDNHYDCRVVQQIFEAQFEPCDCNISVPTLYSGNISFNMQLSSLVLQYDLVLVDAWGQKILSVTNQDEALNEDWLPLTSSSYFWSANLTCLDASDQIIHRKVSGKIMVQN